MKKLSRLPFPRLAALALLLALGACSGVSANGDAPAGQPETLGLLDNMRKEIGTAGCDNASQCKTLPVGHKSCGGPDGYLAFSTKSGNGERLLALAGQYAAARKAENERSGMLSNCMMEPDPGATCVANRCVLVQRGASAQ